MHHGFNCELSKRLLHKLMVLLLALTANPPSDFSFLPSSYRPCCIKEVSSTLFASFISCINSLSTILAYTLTPQHPKSADKCPSNLRPSPSLPYLPYHSHSVLFLFSTTTSNPTTLPPQITSKQNWTNTPGFQKFFTRKLQLFYFQCHHACNFPT